VANDNINVKQIINNMKKTAVEYLKEAISSKGTFIAVGDGEDEFCIDLSDLKVIIEQANRVFEQQIIETWYDCKLSIICKEPTTADEYYNKTYKK